MVSIRVTSSGGKHHLFAIYFCQCVKSILSIHIKFLLHTHTRLTALCPGLPG